MRTQSNNDRDTLIVCRSGSSPRLIRERNADRSKSARSKFPRGGGGIDHLDRGRRRGIHDRGNPHDWIPAYFSRSIFAPPGTPFRDARSFRPARSRGGSTGPETIVRTALGPPWPDAPRVQATGYINYTCKYTGGRLRRSNYEISRYVLAIPRPPFPSPRGSLPATYQRPARTHARTNSRTARRTPVANASVVTA